MGESSLGVEIQRIRDRLRTMRTERDAAMRDLAASRENAEAQRHARVESDTAHAPPASAPDAPSLHAP